MEIFNVGIWEFFFILLIALIVLGPDNMAKTGRTLGRWIYKLIRSPMWAQIVDTSREIRNLPTKIVREAGLEESLKEIQAETKAISGDVSKDLREAAGEVQSASREASGAMAFASAGQGSGSANQPEQADHPQGSNHRDREDSPISPPMQEGDQPAQEEPGDEQIPTDTPIDEVIPREGAKPAPAISEVGDADQVRDEMVGAGAEDSLERPQADQDINNPSQDDVPPPGIIDVDRAASFGDTFIEPFEELTLVEDQDEDAFPDQPLQERPVEQWRERAQEEQREKPEGGKKPDPEDGQDRP